MNKQELEKRIEEVNRSINEMVSKGIMFSTEEMSKFEKLTFELESLNFQLRSLDDGSK